MTTAGNNSEEKAAPGAGGSDEPEAAASPHPWEAELEVYPIRAGTEDPRWAVRTVWIWIGVALFSLAFILTLLILGFFYD